MKKTSFIGNYPSAIPYANIDRIGFYIALYGVAAVLLWIGAFKFHPDEANAISGIILSSPLVSWLYNVMDINQTSRVIGGVEIIAGVLLAAYPFSRKAAMFGGLIASCTFVATVSFILTTPGVLHTSSISGDILAFPSLFGGFLIKDIGLLGISLWVVARSVAEISRTDRRSVDA